MTRWPYSQQTAADLVVMAAWAKRWADEHGRRFMPTAESLQLLDECAAVATGRATRRDPLRSGASATARREPWAREYVVAEVAARLGVSGVRVRYLAAHGWLSKSARHEGREWRVDATAVDAAAVRRAHRGAAGR